LELGKIRTFTAAPIEHSVATNRLCLDMNERFYDSVHDTWSCVGINKYMYGWTQFYERLNRLPNAFALDQVDYDASLFQFALYGQMEIRRSYLQNASTEDLIRLEGVYDSIINSVIILENGDVIRKHTGNPSGSSNTVVDNTMILFRLFAYAWIILSKNKDDKNGDSFCSYKAFMEHVEAGLYGDDNTYTTSNDVVDWFTTAAIGEIWTSIGVTTKSESDVPMKLEEVTFLSQGFKRDDNIWYPVPETNKILSSILYGSKIDDVRWHYLRACALRIESFGNLECRKIISGYIQYLDIHYKNQLVGVCNGVPFSEIEGVWKSDEYIRMLYSGRESYNKDISLESIDCITSGMNKSLGAGLKNLYETKQNYMLVNHNNNNNNQIVRRGAIGAAGGLISIAGNHLANRAREVGRDYLSTIPNSVGEVYHQVRDKFKNMTKGKVGKLKQEVKKDVKKDIKKVVRKAEKPAGKQSKGGGGASVFKNAVAPLNTAFRYVNQMAKRETKGNKENIVHTEFVTDLFSSSSTTAFQGYQFLLNPANASLFPWLSNQAKNYAEFRFNRLTFYFESTVSASTDGTMIVSSSPDANDILPSTKTAMLQYENAQRANVWERVVHHVPKATLNRLPKFLTASTSDPVVTQDLQKEVGKLFLGINGVVATGKAVSELYVSYDCDFFDPQPPTGVTYAAQYSATATTGGDFGAPFASKIATAVGLASSNMSAATRATPFDGGSTSLICLRIFRGGYYSILIRSAINGGSGTFTVLPVWEIFQDDAGANTQVPANVIINDLQVGSQSLIYMSTVGSCSAPWYIKCTTGTMSAGTATSIIHTIVITEIATPVAVGPFTMVEEEMKQQIKELREQVHELKVQTDGVEEEYNIEPPNCSPHFVRRIDSVLKPPTSRNY